MSSVAVAIDLFILSSILLSATCVDYGNVLQQQSQENFQREFELQLDLIENQNVGCLFDSDICSASEICLDDKLFGTCIAAYAEPMAFSYRLSRKIEQDLKAIMAMLVGRNYTWHSKFTQCCVRAALISGSMEIDTDLSACQDFAITESSSEPSTSPIDFKATLRRLLQREDKRATKQFSYELMKRLEMLRRHKYDYALDIPEKKLADNYDNEESPWDKMKEILGPDWGEQQQQQEPWPEKDQDEDSEKVLPSRRQEPTGQVDSSGLDESLALDSGRDLPAEDSLKAQQDVQLDSTKTRSREELLMLPPPLQLASGRGHDEEKLLDEELEAEAAAAAPSRPVESLAAKLSKRQPNVAFIDGSFLWVEFVKPSSIEDSEVGSFIERLNELAGRPLLQTRFSVNSTNNEVYFQLAPKTRPRELSRLLENSTIAAALQAHGRSAWKSYGFGRPQNRVGASELSADQSESARITSTLLVCSLVLAMIAALFVVFLVQRVRSSKRKLRDMTAGSAAEGSSDYKDLCRQRMLEKASEQREPVSAAAQQIASARPPSNSPNSSTGSWSDDPITTDMDITTGHLILSYMEEYLSSKKKLEQEWASLCSYEPDQSSSAVAATAENAAKNRYSDLLPYDHSRVVLNKDLNESGGDYINASYISDSDPKVKAYILAQGPTEATAGDFWQMLWESNSATVVNLTKLTSGDGNRELCSHYWPSEGSKLFHRFEVHLVSEHIWCDSFVVRNFYLKNLATGEARTVTMFHFLAWDEDELPSSAKALLDFRRKVNKSYKGRTSPLVIHCSDGSGRSGTYCLLDLALSRINKGVKEIDLAASLEHLRDQRPRLVKSREQFEFVVTAIAEEVNIVLKTLPQ